MPLFEKDPEQLRRYESPVTPPADFSEFWDGTVAEVRKYPLNARFERVENYLTIIDTFDVTFAGYGGAPIKGWLHLPAGASADDPLPVVVQYAGYGGGRGLVNQSTRWAQAGHAHFIMDTRGQGYGGAYGETPDPHPSAGGVNYAGLMTRGLSSPQDYYYRRVYVDAFRAVEAVQTHPAINPDRVILSGTSQGGGITVAVAGLAAGRLNGIVAAHIDVPFLQDLPRAIDITPRGPYPEVASFLGRHREKYDSIMEVLNYFDGVNLARPARVPALYSVALMDDICPPSTVFASYNAYGTDNSGVQKDIEVYRFNNHEGGQEHHWIAQLKHLQKILS